MSIRMMMSILVLCMTLPAPAAAECRPFGFTDDKLPAHLSGDGKLNCLVPVLRLGVQKEMGRERILEGWFIARYAAERQVWSFNAIMEHNVTDGTAPKWRYSTGVAHFLYGSVRGRGTWIGMEVYGNLDNGEHRAGPVVGHAFSKTDHIKLTGGFGLNNQTRSQVQLIFEHKF